ncbi:hypothetical protein EDD21DRAFT_390740 [Dissophora ornata]|nr:hypothetical protein EDD21DRAFT_390740 [Dissophora ornata]
MMEMLPTQSQRILKSVLETADALVDYAVMAAMAPRRTTGGNATTASVPSSMATGGAGGGSVGSSQSVHGLRPQLSQAQLRNRNETLIALNKPKMEVSIASLVAALSSVDSTLPQQSSPFSRSSDDSGLDDSIQREIAVRAHKRSIVLESLAGLVFRSRQDMLANFPGSNSSSQGRDSLPVIMPRQKLEIMAEERGKNKRRNSSAAASAGTAGTAAGGAAGQTTATLDIRIKAAERECEAGLKAFENLVKAFEEEYHPHKLAKTGINNVATTSAMARPVGMQGATLQAVPPRHARPLPGSRVQPEVEPAAVRSLSMPPWRKSPTPGNQVHTGQDQQNNRSYHNVFESSADVPAVCSRSPSSSALVLIAAPKDIATQAKRYPADQRNVMNRVMVPLDSAPAPVMTTSMMKERPKPNPDPTRMKPKWIVSSSTPTPIAAQATPTLARATPGRSRRAVSATLSATWSAWKDHLLVLEEEEYVILDLSDSDDDGSKVSTDEKGHDARQRNDNSIHNENTQRRHNDSDGIRDAESEMKRTTSCILEAGEEGRRKERTTGRDSGT